MPSLKDLENPAMQQASEVIAADGTLMGKYYTENGNRSVVKYRDISKHVINALIATEDKRFYEHSGIDMKGTMGCLPARQPGRRKYHHPAVGPGTLQPARFQ